MKIALLQLEVLEKNKEANVAHGLQLAAEAAKKHEIGRASCRERV